MVRPLSVSACLFLRHLGLAFRFCYSVSIFGIVSFTTCVDSRGASKKRHLDHCIQRFRLSS